MKITKEIEITELKEKINEFDKLHLVQEIILLGFDGAVRRIIIEENRD